MVTDVGPDHTLWIERLREVNYSSSFHVSVKAIIDNRLKQLLDDLKPYTKENK
jgi:hypothetical protein